MPGRSEASEREALAALSSCPGFQHNELSPKDSMYVAAPSEPNYHLAKGERLTLCLLSLNDPNKQRRYEDRRVVAEIPTNRVCALCSKCASLAGDGRSFSERVSYPTG
jgi:hypothetical protein